MAEQRKRESVAAPLRYRTIKQSRKCLFKSITGMVNEYFILEEPVSEETFLMRPAKSTYLEVRPDVVIYSAKE